MSCILNYLDDTLEATGSNGCYLSINGKNCIDMSCGNGTHIFGHSVAVTIKNGTLYGSLKAYNVDDYGFMLEELTGWDRFAVCSTGAEATMRLARIARAYTGRDKIAMFEGGWHGGCDTWLSGLGIPDNSNLVTLPMDETVLDKISSDLALVMIEPVQGSLPIERKDFLLRLKQRCEETGTLLGFDEIITGFRLAKGGAKEYYGIEPDLVTYGKIAGGGFPIGIVTGKTEVMDVVKKGVRLGGTFSCNPVTLSVGGYMLSLLTDTVYKTLNSEGERFRNGLIMPNCGVGSISRILFTDKPVNNRKERDKFEDQELKTKFVKAVLERGIYIGVNGILFLSTKHTPKIIDKLIFDFNDIWTKLKK